MAVFQLVDLVGDVFRGVTFRDITTGLEIDAAFVVTRIDKMDGDAGLGFAGVPDSLMYMHAVHALASVFGQQRRVDVQYAVRKSFDEIRRDEEEEAGQDDPVDTPILQELGDHTFLPQHGFVNHEQRDAKFPGVPDHASVRIIGHDGTDADRWVVFKIFHDLARIGTVAGGEDGQVMHRNARI